MESNEFLDILEVSLSEFLNYIQQKNGTSRLNIRALENLKNNFHKLSPRLNNKAIINLIKNFEDGQGFINAYEEILHKGDHLPMLDLFETGKELMKELVFEKDLNPLEP